MRILSLLLVLLASTQVFAKRPSTATHTTAFDKISLFGGNVHIDMPLAMQKDREYFHYWDNCPDGGYTVTFKGGCSNKGGMNVQINVHDQTGNNVHSHDGYDPRKHCLKNATILQDTTYMSGNKRYTVIATLAKANKGGGRNGTKTNNYNLSYYIVADGRMLELHYNYWDKDGNSLAYWQDMSMRMANSIRWQSTAWASIQK